jgi:hypothetical protein
MRSSRNPGRYAGVIYVLTSIVGFFSMGYVPRQLIVTGNASATVANILASENLFRLGIAAQLVGQAAFIFVAIALFDLLNGIDRRQAKLMVLLIVVSVPMVLVNEVNSFAALALARGSDFLAVVEKPQREALAMLFIHLHGRGILVAEIFWGLWLFPLARLVYRSRFLPRFLGVWLALAGVAWIVLSLTGTLLPQYQNTVYSYGQPAFMGEVAFMLWLAAAGARPPAKPPSVSVAAQDYPAHKPLPA